MKNILTGLLFLISIQGFTQNFEWVKSFEGTANVTVDRIQIDQTDYIYLMGTFSGVVDFDPGSNTYTLNSSSFTGIFIGKYTSDGDFIWANQISCTGGSEPGEIIPDNLGNVFVTGSFESDIFFETETDTISSTSEGLNDIFISKYDTSGTLLWVKTTGGSSNDEVHSSGTDASGNIFVCGDFYYTADFDPGAGITNLTSSGLKDIFILKLSQNGNLRWAKRLGNTQYDSATKLLVSGENVFITGYFESYVDFDFGPPVFPLNSSERNPFLLSIDTLGNFNWAKHLESTGLSEGMALAVDPFGNIYWTGIVQGTMDLNPGSGILNYTFVSQPDLYMVKLDSNGDFLWGNAWGSGDNEIIKDLVCDDLGNVYATGYFMGTLDFDPSPTTLFLTSIGNQDMFILRMSASGSLSKIKQIGSTNFNIGWDIAKDQSNNLFIGGVFKGQCDFNPSPNDSVLTSPSGLTEGYFAKYKMPLTTSVNTSSFVQDIEIFPNPSQYEITILIPEKNTNATIEIYNLNGQILHSLNTQSRSSIISLNNFAPAIYFVKVITENGLANFKLVKE